MSETATTTESSEGNQGAEGSAAAGSSAEGGSGGSSTADSFAAEREQLETRARGFQSTADREKQRADAAEAELTKLRGGAEGAEADAPQPLTLEQMRAEMRRMGEVQNAVPGLREQFKNADPAILARADSFDTVEALGEALKASHEAATSVIDAAVAEREAALRAQYVEKYGELPAPPSSDGTTAGEVTLEQLNRMSMAEMDQLEQDHPGIIERINRSANH